MQDFGSGVDSCAVSGAASGTGSDAVSVVVSDVGSVSVFDVDSICESALSATRNKRAWGNEGSRRAFIRLNSETLSSKVIGMSSTHFFWCSFIACK